MRSNPAQRGKGKRRLEGARRQSIPFRQTRKAPPFVSS